jgi:hypothetical protein
MQVGMHARVLSHRPSIYYPLAIFVGRWCPSAALVLDLQPVSAEVVGAMALSDPIAPRMGMLVSALGLETERRGTLSCLQEWSFSHATT